MHKLLVVQRFQTNKDNACMNYLSQSLKDLLQIKQRVKTAKLLKHALINPCDYLSFKLKLILHTDPQSAP